MDRNSYYLCFRGRGLSPLASMVAALYAVAIENGNKEPVSASGLSNLAVVFGRSPKEGLLSCLGSIREVLSR